MIITRADKGQALTHNEMDQNLIELRDKPDGQAYPTAANIGIKFRHTDEDPEDFGWQTTVGFIHVHPGEPDSPIHGDYQGSIRQYYYPVGAEINIDFVIPHDYVPGTDLMGRICWSHNRPSVKMGTVSWLI